LLRKVTGGRYVTKTTKATMATPPRHCLFSDSIIIKMRVRVHYRDFFPSTIFVSVADDDTNYCNEL
jgi:hypothetical protein